VPALLLRPRRRGHHLMYRAQIHISRPGALTKFLDSLGAGWNVSLFHYRNHGADIGRVLVGLQVPPEELPKLQGFLDRLDYAHTAETDNPVYHQFLR
jgi:threonine dehydratase